MNLRPGEILKLFRAVICNKSQLPEPANMSGWWKKRWYRNNKLLVISGHLYEYGGEFFVTQFGKEEAMRLIQTLDPEKYHNPEIAEKIKAMRARHKSPYQGKQDDGRSVQRAHDGGEDRR